MYCNPVSSVKSRSNTKDIIYIYWLGTCWPFDFDYSSFDFDCSSFNTLYLIQSHVTSAQAVFCAGKTNPS